MPYDAFISYSHAADDSLAPAVQRALQTLARPWNRRRALEIFRDQTGLAVSPGLWTSIRAGLDESEHFVLLASPGAAESSWVNQEIEHWTATHPIEQLLPVLTAGEWVWDSSEGEFDWDRSTAVPPALRGKFHEEPRHLDLRWAQTETELDLRHSQFREAMAQLAAPMHNMSPQDLESSDVARFRHLVRLRRAAVAALCALLVLVSVAGFLAFQNAREAREQQSLAEQQATRALSLQLLAQAKVLANQQKTLSLLLAAEAGRLAPSEAWGAMVAGLEDTPGLTRVFDIPGDSKADVNALDAAGGVYATVTPVGEVQLWDLDTGSRSGDPLTDTDPGETRNSIYELSATQMTFGPSGTLAVQYRCPDASCNQPGGIQMWDVEALTSEPLPDSAGFSHLTFSQTGDLLAASAPGGGVRVWDLSTLSIAADARPAEPGRPTDLAFSSDDTLLAQSQQAAGHLLVWDMGSLGSADPVDVTYPAGRNPEEVAFGSRGVVASRDSDGRVRLWRSDSGRPLGLLATGRSTVVSLASAQEGRLATAHADGSLRMWQVERRLPLNVAVAGLVNGDVAEVMFDEGQLVSTGSDIRLWSPSHIGGVGKELYYHRDGVTAVAVSSDGVLASGDERGVIRFWDLSTGQPWSQPVRESGGAVTALAFSSASVLAWGAVDGTVHLWDTSTGRTLRQPLDAHEGDVTSLAFMPESNTLAAGYGDGVGASPSMKAGQRRSLGRAGQPMVVVWDASTGSEIKPLVTGLSGGVSSVAFSSERVFAAAAAESLSTWDVKTWLSKTLELVPGFHRGPYTAVAFAPDGKTLASSAALFRPNDPRTVLLWTMPGGDPQGEPLEVGPSGGPAGAFDAMAFSPDSDVLAGAGSGGVQLWGLESERYRPLGGSLGTSPSSSVAFSPDGQWVIAGNSEGAVQAYPATVSGWLDNLCSVVSRNLTQDEWESFVGPDRPYRQTCPQYPGG